MLNKIWSSQTGHRGQDNTTPKRYVIQGDQKVRVHLMITIQSSGAHRRFDHPVHALYCNTQHTLLGCDAVPSGMDLPTFQKNLLPVVDSPKMGLTSYQTIRHHPAPTWQHHPSRAPTTVRECGYPRISAPILPRRITTIQTRITDKTVKMRNMDEFEDSAGTKTSSPATCTDPVLNTLRKVRVI